MEIGERGRGREKKRERLITIIIASFWIKFEHTIGIFLEDISWTSLLTLL